MVDSRVHIFSTLSTRHAMRNAPRHMQAATAVSNRPCAPCGSYTPSTAWKLLKDPSAQVGRSHPMTSHRGLLILVVLASALVAMGACQKAEQQTTRTPADTSKVVSDTSHMMMADTSHRTMA